MCESSLSYPVCITRHFFDVLYCSLWPVWVFHPFCTLSHERQNFVEYLLNTKCVLNLRIYLFYSDNSTVRYYHNCTYSTFSCTLLASRNSVTLEFWRDFRKVFIYIYIYILHFTKFRPAVAQSFHTDRRTDRHT